MTWSVFPYFGICALILWGTGSIMAWRGRAMSAFLLSAVGIAVYFSFILGMWFSLERPPMRTMGETRLWYVFFISVAGIIVYSRWKYRWILSFSTVMAIVFTCVNLFKPEIHNSRRGKRYAFL